MPLIPPGITSRGQRSFRPRAFRRVLCVFPRYADSFGTFQHAYPLLPGVRAFMPPQGLLVIAAYLPQAWEVRLVDENIRPVSAADLCWADVVLISGMHVQRRGIEAINAAAHRWGKLTVLGGPSVSACPEYYPQVDVLHVGEMGDATDALIQRLDHSVARPGDQVVLKTADRLPLEEFPIPAYRLLNLRRYFLGSVQFSSGCPFLCEFCDIPALYGRNPRVKRPGQVLAELDALLAAGLRGAVYFVDDNFVANPAAVGELLTHLIDWQRRRRFPLRFCCEATLNLAQRPDLLDLMRQARFHTIFCGIETPQPQALSLMRKTQNLRQPILQSIRALNDHGLEVVSGIILGLDSDTPETADHILEFVEASQIPMLTVNLLYALPRTSLYERLRAAGRLSEDPTRSSNVVFKMPYQDVMAMWRKVVEGIYAPQRLFDRFRTQARVCFANRLRVQEKVTPGGVFYGASALTRTLWHVGGRHDYHRDFWRVCGPLLRTGKIEDVIHIGVVAHHLIQFTRACCGGSAEACFYADPSRGVTAEPGVVG